MTAEEIARLVSGELRTKNGTDGAASTVPITGIAPLDRAERSSLSFLASAKYAEAFAGTGAGVVLVSTELADTPGGAPIQIIVDKPHDAVLSLLPHFYKQPERKPGIHPTAQIGKDAKIGKDATIEEYAVIGEGAVIGDRVWIGPQVVVGNGAVIGDDTLLYAQCTIYNGARIGRRVLIQSGARIGSDGFGYVFRDNAHARIPHVGGCIIEDDVDIGANSTIDRGSIDDTVVGAGTKVDNLVHIAHNVRIGKLCLIMAQVGIAGSVHVEDGVILAGQVGLSGHLTVGKGARLAAQAGVFGDVPAGETWSGYPARPHRESLRASSALFKLAGMMKDIEALLGKAGKRGDK